MLKSEPTAPERLPKKIKRSSQNFNDLACQIKALPLELQEHIWKSVQIEVSTSKELFDLLITLRSFIRNSILDAKHLPFSIDPCVFNALLPGVIIRCIEDGEKELLEDILSDPRFSSIVTTNDLHNIVRMVIEPNGGDFRPKSEESQDVFVKWIFDQGLERRFADELSCRAAYFGRLDEAKRFKERDWEQALCSGHIAFFESCLSIFKSDKEWIAALRISVVRKDVDALDILLNHDNWSADLISLNDKAAIYFFASLTQDHPFFDCVKDKIFPSTFQTRMTDVVSRKLLARGIKQFRKGDHPWNSVLLSHGDPDVIKLLLNMSVLGSDVDVARGIFERSENWVFEFLAKVPKEEYLLKHALNHGSVEILKRAIQVRKFIDSDWSPHKLLLYWDRFTSIKLCDWILTEFHFSKDEYRKIIETGPCSMALTAVRRILSFGPLGIHEYCKLIELLIRTGDTWITCFLLRGSMTLNLPKLGHFNLTRLIDAYLNKYPPPKDALLVSILEKGAEDLDPATFTSVLNKYAGGYPDFRKCIRRINEDPLECQKSFHFDLAAILAFESDSDTDTEYE